MNRAAVVTLAALLAIVSPAWAAWPDPALVSGFVTGRGVATVQGHPTSQGLVLAREQAEVRAQRELLDLVKGRDYRESSSTATTPEGQVSMRRSSGTLRGARVLDERLLGGTTWEVVVGVPNAAAPPTELPPPPEPSIDARPAPVPPRPEAPTPPPTPVETPSATTAPTPRSSTDARSSIIVNARVAGATAAAWRRIVATTGALLYARPTRGDPGDLAYVQSAPDLLAALRSDLAGDRPLIVHAIAVRGPAGEDVVVNETDAVRIRAADEESAALSRDAVVVVARP